MPDSPLAGTIHGSSSVVGNIGVTWKFACTISSVSSLTGTVDRQQQLLVTIAGTDSIAGALTADKPLSGSIDATTTLSAAFSEIVLIGSIDGVTMVSADIGGEYLLAGSIDSTTTVDGIPTIEYHYDITGTIDGVSSLSGSIQADWVLSGTIASTAEVTANAGTEWSLTGSIVSTSHLTGLFVKYEYLIEVTCGVHLNALIPPEFETWTGQATHRINGSTYGTLTNIQENIIIHRTTGTNSDRHLYVGTECQADYSDIRIICNGHTIPIWIESDYTSSQAIVWFLLPDIPSTGKDIVILWGKSGVSSVSSGATTFPTFFQDFTQLSSIDWTNLWQSSNQSLYSISGGVLHCQSTTMSNWMNTKTDYGVGKLWVIKNRHAATYPSTGGWVIANTLSCYSNYIGIVNRQDYKNCNPGYSLCGGTQRWSYAGEYATPITGTNWIYSIYGAHFSNGSQWYQMRWIARDGDYGRTEYNYLDYSTASYSMVNRIGFYNAMGTGGDLEIKFVFSINVLPASPSSYTEPSHGTWTTQTNYQAVTVDYFDTLLTTAKLLVPCETFPEAFEDWSKKDRITITGGNMSTVSGYVMPFIIRRSSGTSSGNIIYVGSSGCNADYSDIRFTTDLDVQYNQWLEDGYSSSQAVFWVNVGVIPTGTTYAMLYYGNPSATVVSDFYATFGKGDDFNHADIDWYIPSPYDPGLWYTTDDKGLFSIVDNRLRMQPCSFGMGYNSDTYDGKRIVCRARNVSTDGWTSASAHGSGVNHVSVIDWTADRVYTKINTTQNNYAQTEGSQWYYLIVDRVIDWTKSVAKVYDENLTLLVSTTAAHNTGGAGHLKHIGGTGYAEFEFFASFRILADASATEPTITGHQQFSQCITPTISCEWIDTPQVTVEVTPEPFILDIWNIEEQTEQRIPFANGSIEPNVGDTIIGANSGASGTIAQIVVSSGSWGSGTATGYFLVNNRLGDYDPDESLEVDDVAVAVTNGYLYEATIGPKIISITITKSVNQAFTTCTLEIDETYTTEVENYFKTFEVRELDHNGVERLLFVGFCPSTEHIDRVAANKTRIMAYSQEWFLSKIYVPSAYMSTLVWDDVSGTATFRPPASQAIYMIEEVSSKLSYSNSTVRDSSDWGSTGMPERAWLFTPQTTITDAINEMGIYTCSVQTCRPGDNYLSTFYWVPVNDPSFDIALNLPSPVTITEPDPTVSNLSVTRKGDNRYNRIRVFGQNPSTGEIYEGVYSSEYAANLEGGWIEYVEVNAQLTTYSMTYERAVQLYTLLSPESRAVDVTAVQRVDLDLFQKVIFDGYTKVPWGDCRIVSITYTLKPGHFATVNFQAIHEAAFVGMVKLRTGARVNIGEQMKALVQSELKKRLKMHVGTVVNITDAEIIAQLDLVGNWIKGRDPTYEA